MKNYQPSASGILTSTSFCADGHVRDLKIILTETLFTSTIVHVKIIADTNTFLAVTLHEPERDRIIKCTLGHDLIAPDILPFEIGNALSAMLKRRRLEPDDLLSIWDATQQIPVDLRSVNIRDALKIASQYNIYAYDAYFLVCALSLHCPLITIDRRMIEVAYNLGIHVMEVA
ncbi:type II toxin-antitoxin system VapC family toxin [Desulfoplanes sp.]